MQNFKRQILYILIYKVVLFCTKCISEETYIVFFSYFRRCVKWLCQY